MTLPGACCIVCHVRRRFHAHGMHLASLRVPRCIVGHREHNAARHDMIRYGFSIRTRTGQRVDNISIMAGSLADAERRVGPEGPPNPNFWYFREGGARPPPGGPTGPPT